MNGGAVAFLMTDHSLSDTERGYTRARRRLREVKYALEQWEAANIGHSHFDPAYIRRQQLVRDASQALDVAEQRWRYARAASGVKPSPIQQPPRLWIRFSRPRLVVKEDDLFIRLPFSLLDGTGMGRSGEPLVLYRRPPMMQQWNEMERCSIQAHAFLWVFGPPGTGKSCTALAFAASLDRTLWDVVWIHFSRRRGEFHCVWLQGSVQATSMMKQTSIVRDLRLVLKSTPNKRKTIVFLDGYIGSSKAVEAALQECKQWHLEDKENRRLVCVCSIVGTGDGYCPEFREQTDMAHLEQDKVHVDILHAMELRPVQSTMGFCLPSWKFDEYKETLVDDGFFETVKSNFPSYARRENPEDEVNERIKLMEAKYFVTGGNARHMFDFTIGDVVKSLDVAMCDQSGIVKYLRGYVGAESPDVVNRLFAWYGYYDVRLVSKYVVRKLATIFGPILVRRFASVCNVTRSTDGFLFEAWFFAELAHNGVTYQKPSNYLPSIRHRCHWAKSDIVFFDPDEYPIRVVLTDPIWMASVTWNQSGYDAVFVDEDAKLVRFVHTTPVAQYSFNPIHFIKLLNSLAAGGIKRVVRIELVFVVPTSRLTAFQLPVSKHDFQKWVVQVVASSDVVRGSRSLAFKNCRAAVMVVGVDWAAGTDCRVDGRQPTPAF